VKGVLGYCGINEGEEKNKKGLYFLFEASVGITRAGFAFQVIYWSIHSLLGQNLPRSIQIKQKNIGAKKTFFLNQSYSVKIKIFCRFLIENSLFPVML